MEHKSTRQNGFFVHFVSKILVFELFSSTGHFFFSIIKRALFKNKHGKGFFSVIKHMHF